MTVATMTEEEMVRLARNALLVAGHEIGSEGDHWPVIKSTILHVIRDWEALQVARDVHQELRAKLYEQLDRMDSILITCPPHVQEKAAPQLKELREIMDAHFAEPAQEWLHKVDSEESLPIHVKRAQAILRTLEDDNE